MKKLFTLLLFCVASFASAQILDETFDSNANFTTSDPFFSDGFGDFFGLSGGVDDYNGEPVPTFIKPYTGFSGGFLTGMDLDGEGATLPISIEWTGVAIDGFVSLMFSGQLRRCCSYLHKSYSRSRFSLRFKNDNFSKFW